MINRKKIIYKYMCPICEFVYYSKIDVKICGYCKSTNEAEIKVKIERIVTSWFTEALKEG